MQACTNDVVEHSCIYLIIIILIHGADKRQQKTLNLLDTNRTELFNKSILNRGDARVRTALKSRVLLHRVHRASVC